MPREFVITSAAPIGEAECILGAAESDPSIGIQSLWGGGAIRLVDSAGSSLTVNRSQRLGDAADAERILGIDLRSRGPAAQWWTELTVTPASASLDHDAQDLWPLVAEAIALRGAGVLHALTVESTTIESTTIESTSIETSADTTIESREGAS